MKKILLILVLVFAMCFGGLAQRSDGFFNADNDDVYNRISDPNDLLNLPSGGLGSTNNESAPLGNGLIILTAIGAGYAIKKRKQ